MNDVRAIGGFAYIRSVIDIVLARPKAQTMSVSDLPRGRIIASDSLVYNMPAFVSQLDRCFVIRVEIIFATNATTTKVADTEIGDQ
jgi:hypothetical protein